jgi:hypothetical protein
VVLLVSCSSDSKASIGNSSAPSIITTPTTVRRIPVEVVVTTTPVSEPPAGTPSADPNGMPDVVCMNLQDAQDLIQEVTGVFFSRSRDATGEERRQIRDRNWIVVSQEPEPGASIGEGDAVLSVVKTDEPNDC